MKKKALKVPAIIIAIGLAAAIVAALLTGILKTPTITEYDFNYSATYTLNGETKTVEGIYRCRFLGTGEGTSPLVRYYEGTYLSDAAQPGVHMIAQQGGLELGIVTQLSDMYLMGDTKNGPGATMVYEPYLAVFDEMGSEYVDEEMLGKFDAQLLSWELPQPIENTFVFSGFSILHQTSMVAMLVVGLLVIVACIVFVKRDKTVPYKVLDKVSAVLNYIIVLAGIPFAAMVTWLMQIYVSGEELVYQLDLCVPAITAFTIAASLSLRRKGFTKAGFFIQLIGPALFLILAVLEPILPV